MKNLEIRIGIICLSFVLIIISGIWLSRNGKPYHTAAFTVHKLSALLMVIFAIVLILDLNKNRGVTNLEWILFIFSGILFLISFITGALMSFEKPVKSIITTTHKIMPYLFLGIAVFLVIIFHLLT
jgi:NADH:ubiquinone oxidoreductase subunit 6 (subunit J)